MLADHPVEQAVLMQWKLEISAISIADMWLE